MTERVQLLIARQHLIWLDLCLERLFIEPPSDLFSLVFSGYSHYTLPIIMWTAIIGCTCPKSHNKMVITVTT